MRYTLVAIRSLVILLTVFLAGPASAQTGSQQVAQELNKEIRKTVSLKYLLYLPKDYAAQAGKTWPLVLFLHGSGESGTDIEKVKVHGPPKLAAAGKEFPFILVSPQAPSPQVGWNNESLITLLDDIQAKYAVDPDRVYVTGLSMGGYGTWALAIEHPDRFAAIAPICGGGMARRARRIRHLPIWVFHGAKDLAVPLKESQEMVDSLKAAGAAEVKFTVYPEAAHDSWTETYTNESLYTWLLSHKRKASAP